MHFTSIIYPYSFIIIRLFKRSYKGIKIKDAVTINHTVDIKSKEVMIICIVPSYDARISPNLVLHYFQKYNFQLSMTRPKTVDNETDYLLYGEISNNTLRND